MLVLMDFQRGGVKRWCPEREGVGHNRPASVARKQAGPGSRQVLEAGRSWKQAGPGSRQVLEGWQAAEDHPLSRVKDTLWSALVLGSGLRSISSNTVGSHVLNMKQALRMSSKVAHGEKWNTNSVTELIASWNVCCLRQLKWTVFYFTRENIPCVQGIEQVVKLIQFRTLSWNCGAGWSCPSPVHTCTPTHTSTHHTLKHVKVVVKHLFWECYSSRLTHARGGGGRERKRETEWTSDRDRDKEDRKEWQIHLCLEVLPRALTGTWPLLGRE